MNNLQSIIACSFAILTVITIWHKSLTSKDEKILRLKGRVSAYQEEIKALKEMKLNISSTLFSADKESFVLSKLSDPKYTLNGVDGQLLSSPYADILIFNDLCKENGRDQSTCATISKELLAAIKQFSN